MIIDGLEIQDGDVVATDVCIVGAGPAGMSLAHELRDSGLRVSLVDSGGLPHDRKLQSLNLGEHVGYPYWSLVDVRNRRFAGTAHLWRLPLGAGLAPGLKLRPLDPIDFEKRDHVTGSGWPILYSDLLPYYHRALSHFGLTDPSFDGKSWHDSESPPLPDFNADVLRTVVFQYAKRTRYTRDLANEIKNSENITALLNSTIVEIESDETGATVKSVRAATIAGTQFRVTADVFVLAAGGIESPRLMLASAAVHRSGIGNDADLVGRYFMEHPHFVSGVLIPADGRLFSATGLYERQALRGTILHRSLSLAEAVVRREKLLNFTVTLVPTTTFRHDVRSSRGLESLREMRSYLKHGHLPPDLTRHLGNVAGDVAVLADHGVRQVSNRLRRMAGRPKSPVAFDLYQMMEQSPNPSSRVSLSDSTDRFGQPRARLDWKLAASDIESVLRGQQAMNEELRRAGLGEIEPDVYEELPPPGIRGGYHHMGTTRMSTSPADGVVDPSCRVHGVRNLYVAGSSVFPTSGFANPTLTIIALAIRLADHIKGTTVQNVGGK